MPFFNRTTQPYTLLSSRKTGLKEILKFWTGTLSLQILNPIENLWGIFPEEYAKTSHFEDGETLKSCIKQFWNEIPYETQKTY